MLTPSQTEIYFTKNDTQDMRLGDLAKQNLTPAPEAGDFAIIGYPDDEGIKLNGGRIGAALAPKIIRQFLYRMTPSFECPDFQSKICDLGDLIPAAATTPDFLQTLGERHELALQIAQNLYKKNVRIITFGGGHDYGYSDSAAFVSQYKAESKNNPESTKPIVINFDAHLDVRPPTMGFNSGTPFYRLNEKFKDQFHLIEVGIQPQCNSPEHYQWAKKQNIEIVSLNDIENFGWTYLWEKTVLKTLNASTKNRPVYVSFDIDGLTAAEAGGCSQAWATGLKTMDCLKFLKKLYSLSSVKGFGIYEVSPPLDRDSQTSKTAALLAHHYIFNS